MKNTITILSVILLLAISSGFAQAPQAFKYQAIARDNSGNILANDNVSFRISILQGSSSGSSVYTETQTYTTNQFGLANLNIGTGTLVSGNFSTINWGTNNYFVKIEFDPAGGNSFVLMGASQLLSVPYALYAENSGNGGGSNGATGATGTNGTNGSTGATGTNGINGATGATGATGVTGTNGSTGATGTDGTNGTTGTTGISMIGSTGTTGADGIIGTTGADGTVGATGFLQSGSAAGNTPYWDGVSWITNNSNIYNNGGNVGIGTSSPNATAKLQVDLGTSTTNGVIVTGTYNAASTVPNLGAGSRMMFYPGKSAFRAGYVAGTQWDNASVGSYSTALGYNTTASGSWGSTAMGFYTIASGSSCTAMGYSTISSAYQSTAIGNGTTASGDNSTSMGNQTIASGTNSTVMGSYTNAPSFAETVIGQYNTAYTPIGINGWSSADRLFVVANGTSAGTRSDAMTILKGGNVGIGTSNPGAKLEVNGVSGTTIKIVDGNQAAGKVFTSDAAGQGSWQIIANAGGWSTTGNANTVDATNFIGTTNNIPFNIRVNNQKAGRIDQALYNTFWGYQAGNANTTGTNNNASGYQALKVNTIGGWNTANGSQALYSNTTGNSNTANGNYALFSNTTGVQNSANGNSALSNNTTGSYNTANGSGSNGTYTGNNNTTDGAYALSSNVAGSNATAIGFNAMRYTNNSATAFNNANVAVGFEALIGSTTASANTGNNNTATGYQTLWPNTTGSSNTANGFHALYSNTTGNENTAIGTNALYNNISGYDNTANGTNALVRNTSGYYNTALGTSALYYNTTGNYNIGVGESTLNNTTVSSGNTALGFTAGYFANNGSYNTFLGYYAYANNPGYTNSTALGANTLVTASNEVRIGSGVTTIGGPQNWTGTSDARIKTNIHENVPGLEFIKLLRPVTYNKSLKLENQITGRKDAKEIDANNNYEKIIYTGFIAQEVEKAAKSVGYDFSGVDAPKNDKDLYGLRYAEFTVPLVKAVQEQQKLIEDMQKEIEALKKIIKEK